MTHWETIIAAITRAQGAQRDAGRDALVACWAGIGTQEHAQRCVIAHYLADLQSDLADEVAWDERALAEYPFVQDADLAPVGITEAVALAPSLHLNLGDGYLRQGRHDDASEQLKLGVAHLDTLADDGYGRLVRGGLDRLAERLASSSGQ